MRTFAPASLRRGIAVGALALALGLGGCAAANAPAGSSAEPGTSTGSSTAASEANAADQMFVTMMIPHHQQAVEMADMLLAKPDADERVLELAQRIKDAQGPEIEQMQAWLDDWGMPMETGGGGHGGMGHGDGMMSDDDMAALEEASGAEASRLFLEQMIVHHEGAVEMAEDEVEDGAHPDVVALARQMADAQTAEIAEMEALLEQL
ncbi:DUF305 domain-containing protein [Agrococcus terreus]|uniref:DUF305 domain-containing protein n=1 Tax=Agrococcus terreus TaxID=574649 RepID=UPI00384A64A8